MTSEGSLIKQVAMAKRKQLNNMPEFRQRQHCHYQNGKRSFRGTSKEVAGYARRDQYLQWGSLLIWLIVIILSFFFDMPHYITAGLAFFKKYLP